MRSRVHLFLDNLTLDELFFLEQEISRRKERFRKTYTVMSVQVEHRAAISASRQLSPAQARELRRFLGESAAAGAGTQLAYSPDVSLILFNSVEGASQCAANIFSGLAEMNGRQASPDTRLSLKIGISTGEDALAAGSVRCLRNSHLVRRANQCAWKAPTGSLLVDEDTAERWPQKHLPIRLPLEIEGSAAYRVVPAAKGQSGADDDRFSTYLNAVVERGCTTLKYSMSKEEAEGPGSGAWSTPVARAVLTVEAFDSSSMKNLTYTERFALSEYAERMEGIRRAISDRNLGLVKHEEAGSFGHARITE